MQNQKTLKYLIIGILLIVIILIAILIGIASSSNNQKNKQNQPIYSGQNEQGEDFNQTYGNDEKGNIDNQAYFDVVSCIKQYLTTINIKSDSYYVYNNQTGEYVLAVEENKIKQGIYNLLSNKYITQNGITVENLYQKIQVLQENVLFVPTGIKLIQNQNIKSFAIAGIIQSSINYEVKGNLYAVVNINIIDNTFSIEPIYENYNNIEEIKISQYETKVEKNENNTINTTSVNYETIVKDYINLYKRLALGAPETMYNLLDKQYSKARFGNVKEFQQYVENNRQKILGIRAEKYQVNHTENYTQYICMDQNDNYYIFYETAPMQYAVILDTYTIDLPEFKQKYANSTQEEKVLLNLQKFFEALNHEDYTYAYNKLDQTYKQNNFKNQQEFENYAKQTFFKQNKLSAGKPEKQNDLYLYNITITDASQNAGSNSNSITKSFVMQLKEDTNFVMSFSK